MMYQHTIRATHLVFSVQKTKHNQNQVKQNIRATKTFSRKTNKPHKLTGQGLEICLYNVFAVIICINRTESTKIGFQGIRVW